MAILPLDHPEPFATTLGIMLYPGEDDADQQRARTFTTRYLDQAVRWFHGQGGSLAEEDLPTIDTGASAPLGDLSKRWRCGLATGEIFKALFALANTDESRASWNSATRLAEIAAAEHGVPGSRPLLYEIRPRYMTVAHLWAAFSIRGRQFRCDPDAGYEMGHDFQYFLAEAEILRHWGQSWRRKAAKAEPPLPAEVWRVPEGWQPPEPQPGWPPTGKIPGLEIPEKLLSHLKGPGRPRKRA